MAIELQAQTILKLAFLVALLFLLGYLIVKLIILDETIDIMINVNKLFV